MSPNVEQRLATNSSEICRREGQPTPPASRRQSSPASANRAAQRAPPPHRRRSRPAPCNRPANDRRPRSGAPTWDAVTVWERGWSLGLEPRAPSRHRLSPEADRPRVGSSPPRFATRLGQPLGVQIERACEISTACRRTSFFRLSGRSSGRGIAAPSTSTGFRRICGPDLRSPDPSARTGLRPTSSFRDRQKRVALPTRWKDVDNIPPGRDFVEVLSERVGKCDGPRDRPNPRQHETAACHF